MMWNARYTTGGGQLPDAPLVSVVTATYNRSNVLRYAIESVRAQTLEHWELTVVGDACTDDTADVVAGYQDPRVRFVNLAENVGEQSGPNNEGVRLSRGRYVAFLNHDDIWLPDHLAGLVEGIERHRADLVYTLVSIRLPDGSRVLGSAGPSDRFDPLTSVNASSWLLRRSLADEIGPWRNFRECYIAPSQDWLHRAHRAGRALVMIPRLTVIAIPSGYRPRSYADRHEREHREIAASLRRDPAFLEHELTSIALGHARMDPRMGASVAVGPYAVRAVKNVLRRLALRAGLTPSVARRAIGLRRGTFIDRLRRTRGLPPKPRVAG